MKKSKLKGAEWMADYYKKDIYIVTYWWFWKYAGDCLDKAFWTLRSDQACFLIGHDVAEKTVKKFGGKYHLIAEYKSNKYKKKRKKKKRKINRHYSDERRYESNDRH